MWKEKGLSLKWRYNIMFEWYLLEFSYMVLFNYKGWFGMYFSGLFRKKKKKENNFNVFMIF